MKRRLPALLAAALLLTLLTACGGSSGGGSRDYASYDMESPMEEAGYYADWDMPEDEGYYGGDYNSAKAISAPSAAAQSMGPSPEPSVEARPQKLIRTAELSMETTTFDETAAALADLIDRLGGYFADSTSGERGSSSRWANYTIRVPVNNFQTFLNQASELCHETRHHISQQDISERYYDTAGRLKTQNIKLQRLQALLEKAEAIEDIITIQSAISETEQEIDDLSGTLRHYDNQVDYATITLSLEEVYRFSNVPETPKSYPQLLGSAFVDGLRDFGEWLEDITVSLAYSWTWLALIALIVVGIVKLAKNRREKRQNGTVSDAKRPNAPHGFSMPHIGLKKKAGSEPKQAATGESQSPKDENPPTQP